MKKLGLYIHIPFCIKKCKYCGFVSFDRCNETVWKAYFDALMNEIDIRAKEYSDYEIDTVFIGGGTPTIVPPEWIEKMLLMVKEKFNCADNQEITIESNPGTMTAQKLEIYRRAGINRLSIGVQSLNDDVLAAIGRIHDRKTFIDTYTKARSAGFDNINIDLMFSLPQQTDEIWESTLKEAIALRPEHISFYSLQIEEGTEFYDMYKKGILDIADDETDRARYHTAVKMLKEAGYKHYEISNAALEGYESQHNIKYWSLEEYLGIGIAAHSFTKERRFYNISDLEEYIRALSYNEKSGNDVRENFYKYVTFEDEACMRDDMIFEYVFTGLRKTDGISLDDFKKRFGLTFGEYYAAKLDYIRKQIADGFMFLKNEYGDCDTFDNGRLGLTLNGIDISNSIMAEFAE